MTRSAVSAEVLDTLRRYDSPTVSNAIELFGVRPRNLGYFDSNIHALFPDLPPVVGFATTVSYCASCPPDEKSSTSFLAHIDALGAIPGPRIVVFEDVDSPPTAATFGEIMCAVYKRFGCVGIITSGAARDLHAIRRLEFPAFASAVSVSHAYGHFTSIHQPVRLGGITVSPGDVLHADANGVVVVPAEIAADVAEACSKYVAAEKIVLDYLNRTEVDPEGLQQAFKNMSNALRPFRSSSAKVSGATR
ncbi:MAG: RraA family protein [Terriglobales bacterium]